METPTITTYPERFRQASTVRTSNARRSVGVRRIAALLAWGITLGCDRAARDESIGETNSARNAGDHAAAWYHGTRELDVTGDGVADSVHLEATGTRVDSLDVVLDFHVNGMQAFRERWGSSYQLAMRDSAQTARVGAESVLRASLDRVLASVSVRPVGPQGARLMVEDSAALAKLGSRPTEVVSFSYGYETVVRLVWDAERARFVRLWSCC